MVCKVREKQQPGKTQGISLELTAGMAIWWSLANVPHFLVLYFFYSYMYLHDKPSMIWHIINPRNLRHLFQSNISVVHDSILSNSWPKLVEYSSNGGRGGLGVLKAQCILYQCSMTIYNAQCAQCAYHFMNPWRAFVGNPVRYNVCGSLAPGCFLINMIIQ